MSVPNDSGNDFEQVFRRMLPRARRVAYRIVGNHEEADDAAAEAFARAHASWPKVQSLPYLDAWILRVTSNVAIDIVRRRRTFPVDPRWAEHEEATILRVELLSALRSLPRRQREVIVLRYLNDLSEADIAGVLRISAGTVKKTSFRAIATLRRVLGEGWRDEFVDEGTLDAAY